MPSVAVLGTRGYPSYYGGFETAVRKLAPYLVDAGWSVTVYGRHGGVRSRGSDGDPRVDVRLTHGIETKALSTLSYGFTAALDVTRRKHDVALVMNVANGYFLPLMRARGIPTLMNVDGIEWERAKWSPVAKRVFRIGAACSARWASRLVFDAKAIGEHWRQTFGVEGAYIPYGGDLPDELPVAEGLQHRKYVLVVARFVPENSVGEFFAAVPAIASRYPVVIVGSSGYGGAFDEAARRLADTHLSVQWLGHVSDDALLLSLWQHAGVYFHGHSVGGTNPALVQAMAAGAPTLARDTVYNREVLGDAGVFVAPEAEAIARVVQGLMENEDRLDRLAEENIERARRHYSWSKVCADYESALRSLVRC